MFHNDFMLDSFLEYQWYLFKDTMILTNKQLIIKSKCAFYFLESFAKTFLDKIKITTEFNKFLK